MNTTLLVYPPYIVIITLPSLVIFRALTVTLTLSLTLTRILTLHINPNPKLYPNQNALYISTVVGKSDAMTENLLGSHISLISKKDIRLVICAEGIRLECLWWLTLVLGLLVGFVSGLNSLYRNWGWGWVCMWVLHTVLHKGFGESTSPRLS